MTENMVDRHAMVMDELHCPSDGALLLRFYGVCEGFLEGKCRKCKQKHVFKADGDGNFKHILSYK